MISDGRSVTLARQLRGAGVFILISTLGLMAEVARANGPEVLDTAMGLVPVESDSIQLAREYVNVYLSSLRAGCRVNCRYIVKNLSAKPSKVQMAFVAGIPADYRTVMTAYSDFPFRVHTRSPDRRKGSDPKAPTWREEEIAFKMRPVARDAWNLFALPDGDSLPTWNVDIGGFDSTFVVVEYMSDWKGIETGADSVSYEFTYHARPAVLWSGPIEITSVGFNFGDVVTPLIRCMSSDKKCSSIQIAPENFEWNEFGLSWTFQNWEPDSDFTVRITSPRIKER